MKRVLTKLCKNKYAVTTVMVIAMYYLLEVYLYTSAKYSFNKLECMDEKACVRILLVADPQLIGLHNEIVRPLTGLAIFDIDRYLSKTYQVAFNFVKPDVVVFLGDLFDEGSTASQTEFDSYHSRFHKIYGKPSKTLQHVYLPGDNDIGGEGYDVVTREKVLRFYRAFNQSDALQIKTLTFYKYNRLTKTVVKPLARRVSDEQVYVNVGLSHIPFLTTDNEYILNMIATTRPHVIFSAHEHMASIIEVDKETGLREKIRVAAEANKMYQYSLSDDKMYEILVPTASYRMGTNKIGHGYAIIDRQEIIAQGVQFWIAGFETIGSSLMFLFYEIAHHPNIQDRLRDEIRMTLKENGGTISYSTIRNMTYLNMVATETFRKYPVLPFLDRMCINDYQIPDSDITIDAGTNVYVSVQGLHYDPKYFPDPYKFDPERFHPDKRSGNVPFLSFGEGPRHCIGLRFGKVGVLVGVVKVLSEFKVIPVEEYNNKMDFDRLFLLSPKKLIHLKFESLNSGQAGG